MITIFQRKSNEKNLAVVLEGNKKNLMDAMQDQRKSALQLNNTLLDTSSILSYLAKCFSGQHIALNKIQLLKIKVSDGICILPVKVTASGQFSSFVKLIIALADGARPIVLNDFSFQRDHNGAVLAELQFYVFGLNVKPFYNKIKVPLLENPDSIKEMKWGGYLHDQQTKLGFLILPDGKTLEVKAGMVIGVEKGTVMDVKENEISIDVSGSKIVISSNANHLALSRVNYPYAYS